MGQQFLNRIRYYLDALQRFIRSEHPVMLVIGPQGSGKRPLLEAFHGEITDEVQTLSLEAHAELTPEDLIEFLCEQWQLEANENITSHRQQLDYLLKQTLDEEQHYLIICNNAQHLNVGTLAALMHLANQQENPPVSIHILLAGEAELEDKVASLTAQVPPRLLMQPLSKKETFNYINYRIAKVDASNSISPSPEIMEDIYNQSGGFPNLINHIVQTWLCEKILDTKKQAEQPLFLSKPQHKADPTPKKLSQRAEVNTSFLTKVWQNHSIKIAALASLAVVAIGLWLSHKQPSDSRSKTVAIKMPTLAVEANPQHASKAITMQSLAAITGSSTITEEQKTNNAAPVVESLAVLNNKEKVATPATKPVTPVSISAPISKQSNLTPPKSIATVKPIQTITAKKSEIKPPYFTIQLIASDELSRVEHFRQMYKLTTQSKIIWLRKNSTTWYALVIGQYHNKQEAQAAIKDLPKELRHISPWVKEIK